MGMRACNPGEGLCWICGRQREERLEDRRLYRIARNSVVYWRFPEFRQRTGSSKVSQCEESDYVRDRNISGNVRGRPGEEG